MPVVRLGIFSTQSISGQLNVERAMPQDTLPLNQVFSGWSGQRIPSAFAALTRGIEREKARLSGLPYLGLMFRREFDYDGATEYLELLRGFSDQGAAVHYAEELAAQILADSLAESPDWRVDTSWDNARVKPAHDGASVQCAHLRSFRVFDGSSGFNSKYFQIEVLCVDPLDGVGQNLFAYLDAGDEWVSYFISRGKE
jgi:hypothetical protein